MASAKLSIEDRDEWMTGFRWAICEKLGFVPFLHQAEWWCATDGRIVTDHPPREADGDAVKVLIAADQQVPGEPILDQRRIKGGAYVVVRRATLPRPAGRARVSADLGSFKIGKSVSSGIWGAGFGIVPNARIKIIGWEYDTCAPEFEQIIEALCSERGMNMPYDSLQNRPRDGRMFLELQNGARYEARSWERKDGLKGKEDDAYIYAEAYQLPGIECLTDFKQNLERRKGYAVFPTTPDRPWVEIFHQLGHGTEPDFLDWQCTCGVKRDVNPYTFNAEQKVKDQKLMTKEKFAIHYDGQIGRYLGSVFKYQRGQRQFSTASHPDLWIDPKGEAVWSNFRIPAHWDVFGAADTGAFTSGLLATISPTGDLCFFYEQPNYRYIGGKHEFDEESSITGWKRRMRLVMDRVGVRGLWADQNSQFKREMAAAPNAIQLYGAKARLEQRTEILREYFQHGKAFLAPWLEVLPFELEQAQWPQETTAGGRFQRLKKHDHTLDGAEHIAALRPRSPQVDDVDDERLWIESFMGKSLSQSRQRYEPTMGVH